MSTRVNARNALDLPLVRTPLQLFGPELMTDSISSGFLSSHLYSMVSERWR